MDNKQDPAQRDLVGVEQDARHHILAAVRNVAKKDSTDD